MARKAASGSLVAYAALLASLALSEPAAAATQIADTNEFVSANGRYSFSLSLTSSSGSAGLIDVPSHQSGVTVYRSANRTLDAVSSSGETVRLGLTLSGSPSAVTIATVTGSLVGPHYQSDAPITAEGTPYAGTFYAIQDASYSQNGNVTLSFRRPGGADSAQKSLEILWGSIGETETFRLNGTPFTGLEIMEAAASLGLGMGNSGSFYVTFNALGAESFSSVSMASGPSYGDTGAVEFVATNYSAQNNYIARDAFQSGAGGDGGGDSPASPAPVPALGGTIPGLILAGTAWVRRRRRRR